MRFRTPYDPEYQADAYGIDNDEPSLSKQSMKHEVDINNIVERFRATGLVSHLAKGQPAYIDVSEIGDYRQALHHVQAVGEWFMGLPADLRAEFDNEPAEFLDFVNDPANKERLAEYGLAEKAVAVSGETTTQGADNPADAGESTESQPSEA